MASLLKTLIWMCDALIRLLNDEQRATLRSCVVFQMQLCQACSDSTHVEKWKRITV